MRNVVLAMHTTVNGRLDDPGVWFTGVPDDVYTDIDRGYETFDTILVGTATYDEMVAYWPGAETEDGDSAINKAMARKMNAYKKYVFTTSQATDALAWNNAEAVTVTSDDDIVAFVRDLKAQPGRDITLAGGARLAATLARLGLIDEYRFFTHPVFSPGSAWFDQIRDQRALELVSATSYDNGVVGMYYRPSSGPDRELTSQDEKFLLTVD